MRSRPPSEQRRSRRPAPALEPLEDRVTPATFNVNSTADAFNPSPGVVTLRSAIQAANTTPGNNIINLTVRGTYKITIPGAGSDLNRTGDFDILGKAGGGNLIIVNTSRGAVTVSGNQRDRVFDINPNFDPSNPNPAFTVTMQGFTITRGRARPGGPSGAGGGVRAEGNASLTLSNMVVTGNTAAGNGGGVAMQNAVSAAWTLTLNNTSVTRNTAGDAGGGIETDGAGKVIINAGSMINANSSVNQGGGIWLDAIHADAALQSATLKMNGTIVANNKALAEANVGGGIGTAGNGTVTIFGSTVKGNASGGVGGGYGDENGQATLNVFNSTFIDNTSAGHGGGIAAGGPTTTVGNCEIDGNTAGGNGGGLWAHDGRLVVQASTFANNTAGNGGGIEVESNGFGTRGSSLTNVTVTGNVARNDDTAYGGGVDAGTDFIGDLLLMNCTVDDNAADVGGGVFWRRSFDSQISVQNTIIADNSADVGPDVASDLLFVARLSGANETPPNDSPGTGTGYLLLSADQTTLTLDENWSGLLGAATNVHIHEAPAGLTGAVVYDATGVPSASTGAIPEQTFPVTAAQVDQLFADNVYTNIHSTFMSGPPFAGEVRGQFVLSGGVFEDLGGNLIGVGDPDGGGMGFTDPTTRTGTADHPLDPQLGPLQNNGGPTVGAPGYTMVLQTQAPRAGSAAIGNGVFTGAPLVDARGLPSIVDGEINVGAVSGAGRPPG